MIVKIEGLDDLQRLLKKMPDEAEQAAKNQLEKAATDLQGKAQMIAPVDVGDLRGSAFTVVGWRGDISVETSPDRDTRSRRSPKPKPKKFEAIVGFAEPYALRQHEDTSYHHPKGGQPKYLENPYKENQDKYVKSIGEAIRRAVEK